MNRFTLTAKVALLLIGATAASGAGGEAQTFGGSRLEFVEESFEGYYPPPGWEILNLSGANAWEQTSYRARTGQYSTRVFYNNNTPLDVWLVTPALNTTAATSLYLEFYESQQYWNNYGEHHYIMVSTTSQTDPAAFDIVLDMTPDNHTIAGFDAAEPVTVDLTAYVGQEQLYVAFRYTGYQADVWYVDDVWIFQPEEHDIKTASVTPVNTYFTGGESFTPEAVLVNIGQLPESFDVICQVGESGEVVYTDTQTVTDLPAGESIALTFAPYTVTAGNYVEVIGTALLEGDDDPANDSKSGYNYAYSRTRVPHGLLVTSWDCSGCPQANQALDEYLADQGNSVAVMRVHCWWPGGGDDPMYLANIEQNTALIEGTPTGSDYAPHLWIDGNIDAEADGIYFAPMFEDRKQYGAALEIALDYDAAISEVHATVDITEPLVPGGMYRLKIAITEDNIYAPGGNGEEYHNQAFRYMYPDVDGLVVEPALGVQEFWVATPLDDEWVFENLRVTAYIQELNTLRVVNAATRFLAESTVAVGDEPPPLVTQLVGAVPNPFNPRTTVTFTVAKTGPVRIAVYDLIGRRVSELTASVYEPGAYAVGWDGTDSAGRSVASGVYVVRMESAGDTQACKILLTK
jgi:hypothetical protein